MLSLAIITNDAKYSTDTKRTKHKHNYLLCTDTVITIHGQLKGHNTVM